MLTDTLTAINAVFLLFNPDFSASLLSNGTVCDRAYLVPRKRDDVLGNKWVSASSATGCRYSIADVSCRWAPCFSI